ncbi:MAG: RNA methyltransferase [Pseudoflavonifractor sp.]
MELITSRQNALVARIRKLGTDRSYRRETGLFLCEGVKLVGEALKWGAAIETLVCAEGTILPEGLADTVRVAAVPAELLKTLSTVETPQGLLAVCQAKTLAPPPALAGRHYLVLDGVQDPGNVGTIWRTADAFGADGIFLVNACADPYSPKTVRGTMGAAFRLPVWEIGLTALKLLLDAAEIALYATALRDDTVDLREVKWDKAAVIIGSEGRGASPEALSLCAKTIKIPMRDRCESLNAAVAASVVLWEMAQGRE